MSGSREVQEDISPKQPINMSFILVEPSPELPQKEKPNLPKKAKLNTFDAEEEIDQKSFNDVKKVIHKGRPYFTKKSSNHSLNSSVLNSPIWYLESAAAALFRLIASPKLAPSTHPLHDESDKVTGILIRGLPRFVPHSKNPIKKENLGIELIDRGRENNKTNLRLRLNSLIEQFNKRPNNNQSSYLSFGSFYHFTKKKCNLYLNSDPTADHLYGVVIKNFIEKDFTEKSLSELFGDLNKRIDHIKKKKKSTKNEDYKTELDLLNECQKYITAILFSMKETELNIPALVAIDKIIRREKIDIDQLNEETLLERTVNDTLYGIKVKHLKNFRIQKGLAKSKTTRFILGDDDDHANNFSLSGQTIDFDSAFKKISYKFKNETLLEKFFRRPTERTFAITPYNVRNFPNLEEDTRPFFWCTDQPLLSDSKINELSSFFDFKKNLFTKEQNKIFQQLSDEPVFSFYSYLTFLKFILIPKEAYKELIALHMKEDIEYINLQNQEKMNLSDEINTCIENRIKEAKETLENMPEFYNFLCKHGDFAFSLIEKELKRYREKHLNKTEEKPYYTELVEALDLKKIKQQFSFLKETVEEIVNKNNSDISNNIKCKI